MLDALCAAWLDAVDCALAAAHARLHDMYTDLLQPLLNALGVLGASSMPRAGSLLLLLGYAVGVAAYYLDGVCRGAMECVVLRRRTLPIILRVPDALGCQIIIETDWAAAVHGAGLCAGALVAPALFWPAFVWPMTLLGDTLLPAIVLHLMSPARPGQKGAWKATSPFKGFFSAPAKYRANE